MMDFVYSSRAMPAGALSGSLPVVQELLDREEREFHGEWGSLAVRASFYNGFAPIVLNGRIYVVVGAPVLLEADNSFLVGEDPAAGARLVAQGIEGQGASYVEKISGPFAILIIDTVGGACTCITDLMGFIPVFAAVQPASLVLSTHVDAAATAAGTADALDPVSLADFILNDVVTFPFTIYKDVRQLSPAVVAKYQPCESGPAARLETTVYWEPVEEPKFGSVRDAGQALSAGMRLYVERLTVGMNNVAQFMSGGEDSRVVSALLPSRLKRTAFTFLDSMNREGRLAAEVARSHDVELTVCLRKSTHYADILPGASALLGSHHRYTHSHCYGVSTDPDLRAFDAVLGGYSSDVLLKAHFAKKDGLSKILPFLPERLVPQGPYFGNEINELFGKQLSDEVRARRQAHLDRVREIRPESFGEWFHIWPTSMRPAAGNLASNRRLFASYEIFNCNDVAKISSAVPTDWKLNRKLFHEAFRGELRKSAHVPHADGRYPHLSWKVNALNPGAYYFLGRKVLVKAGFNLRNEGAWCDWDKVICAAAENYEGASPRGQRRLAEALNIPRSRLREVVGLPMLNVMQLSYALNND